MDILRRYFVGNPAPILSVRYDKRLSPTGKFVRTPCGNSDGFFWRRWRVCWRKPYAKVWRWHPSARKWMTNLPPEPAHHPMTRRATWIAILVAGAIVWALALIGAASLIAPPACLSIWDAAKTALPVGR